MGTTRTRGSEVSASYLKKNSIFFCLFFFSFLNLYNKELLVMVLQLNIFFFHFLPLNVSTLTHFSLFFCLQVHNTKTKINRKLCPRRWFYKNLLRAGSFSFPSHLFRPAVEKLVGNALTSRYSRSFPQLYGERKL